MCSTMLTAGLNGGILWTVLVTRAFWYCFLEVPSGARHLFTGDIQYCMNCALNNKRIIADNGQMNFWSTVRKHYSNINNSKVDVILVTMVDVLLQ
jgi:hypothetical protein